MTLAVASMFAGRVAFLSDSIVTAETIYTEENRSPTLDGSVGRYQGEELIAGLHEKVVVLDNECVLALAGNAADCWTLVKYVRDNVSSSDDIDITRSKIITLLKAYSLKIEFMLVNGMGSVNVLHHYGATVCDDEDIQLKIFAIGSGARDFLLWWKNIGSSRFHSNLDSQMSLTARVLTLFLAYTAQLRKEQILTGRGVREGWGGVFEFALPVGTSYQKVDRILFLSAKVFADEKPARTFFVMSGMYQRYNGDCLEVYSLRRSGCDRYLVRPFIGELRVSETSSEKPFVIVTEVEIRTKAGSIVSIEIASAETFNGAYPNVSVIFKQGVIRIPELAAFLNVATSSALEKYLRVEGMAPTCSKGVDLLVRPR